jgi:dTDP-glucose pyrophosphorylase
MINTKKLKKNILKENSLIKDVVSVLNKSKYKICIITGKNNKPIGIFTDEDLRRNLIKQESFNKLSKSTCNKKFIFCLDSDNDKKINKLFKKFFWINSLVVLNKKKQLKGIIDKVEYLKENFLNNEVLVLAGGLGKRLMPLTQYYPKPMLNFGGKPLLESIIYSLKASGFKNINLSVNHLSKVIQSYFGNGDNYNIKIKYFKESFKLGTAGPLFFFKKQKLKESIILINGDIYTTLDFRNLLNFHERFDNDITVCSHDYINELPYGVIQKKNKFGVVINEKPKVQYEINSGIYAIKPNILNLIIKKKFLNMNDLVNNAFKKKRKIGFFKIFEPLVDIGSFESYEKAKEIIGNDK